MDKGAKNEVGLLKQAIWVTSCSSPLDASSTVSSWTDCFKSPTTSRPFFAVPSNLLAALSKSDQAKKIKKYLIYLSFFFFFFLYSHEFQRPCSTLPGKQQFLFLSSERKKKKKKNSFFFLPTQKKKKSHLLFFFGEHLFYFFFYVFFFFFITCDKDDWVSLCMYTIS